MTDSKFNINLGINGNFSKNAPMISKQVKGLGSDFEKFSKNLNKDVGIAKSIQNFSKLEKVLSKSANKINALKEKQSALKKEIKATESPTEKQLSLYSAKQKALQKLINKQDQEIGKSKELRGELKKAGVDVRNITSETEKYTKAITKQSQRMEKYQSLQANKARRLQNATNVGLVGAGMMATGRKIQTALASPIEQMRTVQRSRGELQSLGMSKKGVDEIEKQGMQMSGKYAGITADTFVSAAYDIRSGIDGLTEKGVASMTASSALVAKATKAEVGQMTSLFATSYGIFKESMPDLSDAEFGEQFGAALAGSVKQFKTTGAGMQQAIESAGSGAALKGMSMFEELSVLGMLQSKMKEGVAGTSLKSYAAKAEKADAFFKDEGVDISTTTDNGKLESIASVIKQIKSAYGSEYTTKIGDIVQKAFGSEEAVKLVEGLWGTADKIDNNIKGLKARAAEGSKFTSKMAANMDNNMDAKMMVMQQKWNNVTLKIGNALIPALDRMMPYLNRFADWFADWVGDNEGAAATVASLVAGFGLLIAGGGGLIIALASLSGAAAIASTSLRGFALKNAIAGGGAAGVKGGFGKGAWSQLGKMSKVGGIVGLGIGATQLASSWSDDDKTRNQALSDSTGVVGGLGGAWAGAKTGALVGAFAGPLGAAIGGTIGMIGGGVAGAIYGDDLGDAVFGGESDANKKSELIFNKLTTAGVIDHDAIGNSQIENWQALEQLKASEINALMAYDDFSSEDSERMKNIYNSRTSAENSQNSKQSAVSAKQELNFYINGDNEEKMMSTIEKNVSRIQEVLSSAVQGDALYDTH